MLGSKLRSWMEAVRPRKKQNRKEKLNKSNVNNVPSISNWQSATGFPQNDQSVVGNGNAGKKITSSQQASAQTSKTNQTPATSSRYSANNLSSPESAYSTGYSTDGTSPGAPPDCYANIRTGVKYFATNVERHHDPRECEKPPKPATPSPCISRVANARRPNMTQEVDGRIPTPRATPVPVGLPRLKEVISSPVLTSPRQRNRIRTNPWVPTNTLSPIQIRQEIPKIIMRSPIPDSPRTPRRFANSRAERSPTSSSCSSLSGGSLHWDSRNKSASEDDCTLNEMMGKYDESYVYEKETDILSDSDPTDCDTDIDTGQDGGDEDDPLEGEFDFIDNGSLLELDPKDERNTGHCTYYNFEAQRRVSRRRTTRRSKQCSEKRRRSSNSKKTKHKQEPQQRCNLQLNGSKSAGATPVSVRRTKHHPVSKLALEDCLRKRSNSISFPRDPINTIDRRDKEADRKYKELIVEAEQILRSMKTNGLSPRRVPGPANKRVEILRSLECPRPESSYLKSRLNEELPGTQFPKMPSINLNCPRFSPKRNHITNFIINNSPVMLRRGEVEMPTSPLAAVRQQTVKAENKSPQLNNRNRSPKYRKKMNKSKLHESSSGSDSEGRKYASHDTGPSFGCPQSEPVRRKVYSGHGKTVAFNLNYENVCNNSPPYSPARLEGSENLRQQVLLNTIANLKRSLEDQSASLKQVYQSSQNIHF